MFERLWAVEGCAKIVDEQEKIKPQRTLRSAEVANRRLAILRTEVRRAASSVFGLRVS